MFDQLLPAEIFGPFLVFARIGSAFVLLPGFGEAYVAPRWRLLLALGVSLILYPTIAPSLPRLPSTSVGLVALLAAEIGTGLFIGFAARATLVTLQTAGMIIGFQTSLANAFAFDPSSTQQGALMGAWMTIIALVLIFATDLHHVMLRALAESYAMLPAGGVPPVDDFADAIARVVAQSFLLGVRIAAPFLVFGLIFFLALGLLARLMPQMQVFFVSMPLQIAIGLTIFAVTIATGMRVFLEGFEETLSTFFIVR
ncbi:MAG: flagellar type III secretion system protein FliR [Rhodospirillales bacterium]|nr:flagellar type III secretion system protein FliR [Rhodospirillales bacterium]